MSHVSVSVSVVKREQKGYPAQVPLRDGTVPRSFPKGKPKGTPRILKDWFC